jgi:hypothetical protein
VLRILEDEAVCPHDLEEDRQWATEPVGGTTRGRRCVRMNYKEGGNAATAASILNKGRSQRRARHEASMRDDEEGAHWNEMTTGGGVDITGVGC